MTHPSSHEEHLLASIPVTPPRLPLVARAGQEAQEGAGELAPSSAASTDAVVLRDCPIMPDTNFGGVFFDIPIDEFGKLGFSLGDCVSISFSNGYELREIPYYNGFYAAVGDPLLLGYPGSKRVKAAFNYGDTLWDAAGLSGHDTVTVTLIEAGRFLTVQEAFNLDYSNERDDYPHLSDVEFANFRTLTGGRLVPHRVYRSASPIYSDNNRAAYVEALMEEARIAYVLNLSDSTDEVDELLAASTQSGVDTSYFARLNDAGLVMTLNLTASYPSEVFAQTLAEGLANMSAHKGPYLIHCTEGKDRTGFVCIVLEALAGASYDEMLDDYMCTYENYYGITRESDPDKYEAVASLNLDNMLCHLCQVDENADLRALDYVAAARTYLENAGMTDEQSDALLARIATQS